ncbi:MAG: hypothetical protein IK055_02005 [Lachnospiraceae bacterium]|nr:hypothetical protein [Lachnospiraceae bacterium]
MKVLGFPFRQVGELLRNMSLSGTSGNVCAWGIYVILCLIPVAVLIALIARKKAKKIDFCLIPIAIAEAAALYLSVNPLLIGDWDMYTKPLVDADMRIATIGASFYSLLMCYLVLRFCIKLLKGSREETFRQIVRLCVLAFVAILVFAVFDVIEFADTVKKMPKTDTADRAFAVWKGTFSAITQLGLAVTLLLTGLIVRRYRIDGATEANEKRVRKFTVFCIVAIVLYLLGVAAFNVGQLLCINRLLSFDISLILPVSELVVIAFIPAALHMMRETREVKEENSLYI